MRRLTVLIMKLCLTCSVYSVSLFCFCKCLKVRKAKPDLLVHLDIKEQLKVEWDRQEKREILENRDTVGVLDERVNEVYRDPMDYTVRAGRSVSVFPLVIHSFVHSFTCSFIWLIYFSIFLSIVRYLSCFTRLLVQEIIYLLILLFLS